MGLLPRQLWLLPRLGNHEIFCYHVLPPIFKPHLPFNGPTGKSNQGKEWIFTKLSLHSKTEILHYSFCKLKPGLWSFEVRELSAILRRSNARCYVSFPPVITERFSMQKPRVCCRAAYFFYPNHLLTTNRQIFTIWKFDFPTTHFVLKKMMFL